MYKGKIKASFPGNPGVNQLECILLDSFHELTNMFLYNFKMRSDLAYCAAILFFHLRYIISIIFYVPYRATSFFFSMCTWYSFVNTTKMHSCMYASLSPPVFPHASPWDWRGNYLDKIREGGLCSVPIHSHVVISKWQFMVYDCFHISFDLHTVCEVDRRDG